MVTLHKAPGMMVKSTMKSASFGPSVSFLVWLLLAIISSSIKIVDGCTVFVVGKDASTDGSVMVSHSNDGEFDTDPRLVKIPAADYKPGDKRPVRMFIVD